jgi:tetratricopeptide (TPR) repeat protein
MLKGQSTYSSKVFNDFKAINPRNAEAVIRFYNQNKATIHELRFDEAFVLQLHYTYALYQTGQYFKHLREADNIILWSIENNIQYCQGEDVYQKTLFQKANSCYKLRKFDHAKHIYLELIRIAPNNKEYLKGLSQTLLKTDFHYVENILLAGIFTFLFSIGFAVLILLSSLFFASYSLLTTAIVSSMGIGVLLLFAGFALQNILIQKQVQSIQKAALQRKESKNS